jgi:hypothetical protein
MTYWQHHNYLLLMIIIIYLIFWSINKMVYFNIYFDFRFNLSKYYLIKNIKDNIINIACLKR